MFEAVPSRSSAKSSSENSVTGLEDGRSGFVEHESIITPSLGLENVHSRQCEKLPSDQLNILNTRIGHVNVVSAIKKGRMV